MRQKLQKLKRILCPRRYKRPFFIPCFLIFLIFFSTKARSQTCNTDVTLTAANFSNLSTVASNSCLALWPCDKDDLIDNNASNSVSMPFPLLGTDDNYLEVRAGNNTFLPGTFAGFDIEQTSILQIGLFNNITISTYLNGTLQESKSGNGLAVGVTLLGSSRKTTGFITTKNFNRIRITASGVSVSIGSLNIYSAVVKQFCEPLIPIACNTPVQLYAPAYPMVIDDAHSGAVGVGLGNSIVGLANVLDANLTNYATISKPTASLGTNRVSLSVSKALSAFQANSFAGFDIETIGLLDLSVLNGMTITLLNNGDTVQSGSGSSLIAAGIPLLTGSGRRTIGLLAAVSYNEMRLTVDFGFVGLGLLTETRVYGPVVTNYCVTTSLNCNEPTQLKQPAHPIYVDGRNTGIQGTGAVGSINNWDRAIDNSDTSVARIIQTVGLLSTASFTVGDALTTYPAKTFAGFKISTATLLNAGVLNYYTIQLLRDGNVVQTSNASTILLDVNSILFNGAPIQTVGIVSDTTFDAVKLSIEKPVGVDLGIVDIHGLLLEELCPVVLSCNQSSLLQYGAHPVVINTLRTGVLGIANVGAGVANTGNVLTASTTDYAQLSTVASVLSNASISVLNPVQSYPAGTFAGFVVENANGLLDVGLLNSLTVNTYLDGNLQESVGGSSLIDLTLLITILGPGNNVGNIGFATTKPFDEIQLSMGEVLSVTGTLKVYGAVIDTRSAIGGGLFCKLTYPDFAVTSLGKIVVGDVSVNDRAPIGTTYGIASPDPSNPDAANIIVASDGTYTFTPTLPGIYKFTIPVCLPGQTVDCTTERMTITVTEPFSQHNYPIVNDDVAVLSGGSSITNPTIIKVGVNDAAGNYGGTLGLPSVANSGAGAPLYGTVSVDGDGNIVYTPNANYFGNDQFAYTRCESPSGLCSSATVFVTVVSPDVVNSTFAGANFYNTIKGQTLDVNSTEGLLNNAMDPEGNTQTIVPKTETISGIGTLTVFADGSFNFVPEGNFTGPVIFDFVVNDNGSPVASARGTVEIFVGENPLTTYPDIAVTVLDKTVEGSVAVNDRAPEGTSYGTAAARSGNPAATPLTVNSDGTFTFTPTAEGVYEFDIPVCLPGQLVGCATERITIYAFSQVDNDNLPIVNSDNALVRGDNISPATQVINVKANDATGNTLSSLGMPTVANSGTGAPQNGVVAVDIDGNIHYTPNPGFFGIDSFTYTICETPANTCGTAFVKINVVEIALPNLVVCTDDYISTAAGETITTNAGNGVLINDKDLNGAALSVIPKVELIPGKGTLTLNADGSYEFVPVLGFSGNVVYQYEVSDGGIPVAGAKGSLHINVIQYPDITAAILLPDNTFTSSLIKDAVVYLEEVKGAATAQGKIAFSINAPVGFAFLPFDQNLAAISASGGGSYSVSNNAFDILLSTSSQIILRAKPGYALPAYGVVLVGIRLQHSSATNGDATATVNIYPDAAKRYDCNTANNVYYRVLLKQ